MESKSVVSQENPAGPEVENSSLTTLFHELVRAQIRAWNAVHTAVRSVPGMSAARLEIMRFIDQAPGGVGVGDVAASQQITISAASRLLDRLEADGLVTRERDSEDQRRQVLTVTVAGRTAVEQALPLATDALASQFAALSPQDRVDAAMILERIGRTHA